MSSSDPSSNSSSPLSRSIYDLLVLARACRTGREPNESLPCEVLLDMLVSCCSGLGKGFGGILILIRGRPCAIATGGSGALGAV
jgi:hypothetical protein